MVIDSYAKINLTLNLRSKNNKGLHEIQSYFCLIDLADKIKLKKIKSKKDKVIFKGPFAKFVNKSNNSIINLLKLLRRLKLISSYYSVIVKKNIPVFGALSKYDSSPEVHSYPTNVKITYWNESDNNTGGGAEIKVPSTASETTVSSKNETIKTRILKSILVVILGKRYFLVLIQ